MNIAAELGGWQRAGRVVEDISPRLDIADIMIPALGIHGNHQVDAAAATATVARLSHSDLVPSRQTLDVRWEDVTRSYRHAHSQDGARKEAVGARRARAIDIGKLHDEIVGFIQTHYRHDPLLYASAISSRNFCISQAPVGQR